MTLAGKCYIGWVDGGGMILRSMIAATNVTLNSSLSRRQECSKDDVEEEELHRIYFPAVIIIIIDG